MGGTINGRKSIRERFLRGRGEGGEEGNENFFTCHQRGDDVLSRVVLVAFLIFVGAGDGKNVSGARRAIRTDAPDNIITNKGDGADIKINGRGERRSAATRARHTQRPRARDVFIVMSLVVICPAKGIYRDTS